MHGRATEAETHRPALNRRKFIAGVGAGTAGALTLGANARGAYAATDQAVAVAATRADRFGRMFPGLPAFAPANDRVRAACVDIGKAGGLMDARDPLQEGPVRLITNPELSPRNLDNPLHTAGTTFLGQFLDHDMTFDTTSALGQPTAPESSPNSRTPALDLDSVYGRGPVADSALYDPADRTKLRIESNGLFEDVPRTAAGSAIIADPRNDEHVMIAGLQAAMILFHNRVVDRLRGQGVPASRLFADARRTVTWHYQWIIVNEFLNQIVGFPTVQEVLTIGRRFYRPEPGPAFIPVEFQGAVYRFGHSMVRPSYRANLAGDNGQPFFGFIFDPTQQGQPDPADLRGGSRARRRFVGWQTFFDFRDGQVRPNKRIDTNISTPLFHLPLAAIASGTPPISLPQRNLLRHITWEMPSGQAVARAMGVELLQAGDLMELAQPYGLGFENSTPLWYYALREAAIINNGARLGPVGGRIVAEVFIGLLQLDPTSYLAVQPGWRPTLPGRSPGNFTMVDLLTFARVDPASRGQ
jgi:hypothetical protein